MHDRTAPEGEKALTVSTSELAEGAAELVKHVRETGQAVMVLEDGEPAVVIVTASRFAELDERGRLLSAVAEGLADIAAGRVMTTDELKASLEAELGPIAWQ